MNRLTHLGPTRGALVGALAALAVGATPAAATEPGAADPCTQPSEERPPDPRCGEELDGRPTPGPTSEHEVPRAALAAPRVATRAVFWPVVTTLDFWESRHIGDWLQALLTTDDGLVGVRPELTYSTGFVSTVGAHVFYRRFPGPGSEVVARALTGGPSVVLGELDLRGPAWLGLASTTTWNRRDDRLFAGIGPSSQADLVAAGHGLARYGSDVLTSDLRWSRPILPPLAAIVHGDLQRRDYRSTPVRGGPSVVDLYGLPPDECATLGLAAPCVDPALLPGFAASTRLAHVGTGLSLDLRRHARDGNGVRIDLDGTYAQGIAGDPSRHVLVSGQTVAALGGSDRVLLLRARAAAVQPVGFAPVPFDELVSPSGPLGMRGFADGRFRGESGAVGSAEYRWFIAHYLDASLFADYGTVAGRWFADLGSNHWFPSFGVGIRQFHMGDARYWDAEVKNGVQLAYAPDGGFRLLLSVAPF